MYCGQLGIDEAVYNYGNNVLENTEIIDEVPEIVEAEGKEEETIQEKVIEPVEEIRTEPEISEVYEPKTVTIDYNTC